MDRDDYISKLFIKSQDKLNTPPSDDLWSRIETKLEQQAPVSTPSQKTGGKIVGLSRYFAAASILLVVSCSVYMIQLLQNRTAASHSAETIVMNDLPPLEEIVLSEEALPITASEEEERFVAEDKKQEARILESVKESTQNKTFDLTDKADQIDLEEIAIAEEISDIIIIEPEMPVNNTLKSSARSIPVDEETNTEEPISEVPVIAQSRNYAAAPSMNSIANQQLADQIVKESENKYNWTNDKLQADRNRRGLVSKKSKETETQTTSPMSNAHPRLQMFGWLLGKWVDHNETEGTSYETWQLKSSNVIAGKGYKLSKEKERIFEEMMRIEYRNESNQVFLVISLGENNETLDYMLTEFDTERIIFKQSASKKYPDEVILQREFDGFTTILVNNSGFLGGDQQRYLENRNRVSNVRAIRTLKYEE